MLTYVYHLSAMVARPMCTLSLSCVRFPCQLRCLESAALFNVITVPVLALSRLVLRILTLSQTVVLLLPEYSDLLIKPSVSTSTGAEERAAAQHTLARLVRSHVFRRRCRSDNER